MNDKYKLTLQEADGTLHQEEYNAFIGIELKANKVLLHIRENGDLSEDWWRQFPALLQSTIDKGLEARKKQVTK